MTATIDYLTSLFTRFNDDYFDSKLPLPHLRLSRAKTRLGTFSCRKKKTWRGWRIDNPTISISTYYDMTERQIQNVMLHEMIHYAIALSGVKDTSAHGVVFRGMMDNLNRKYGWEISIRQNTREWETTSKPKVRQRLILAMRLKPNRCFLTVVSPKHYSQLNSRLSLVPELVEYRWFTSSDAYFSDFPVVRTMRLRRVDEETYLRFSSSETGLRH